MEDENMQPTDQEISDLIAALVEAGAMEILGYDSISDQFTYKITEKCKEIYPELYYSHFEAVGEIARKLWMDDIVDIVFSDGETVVGITDLQYKHIKDNILTFEEDERLFLESILQYYDSKE